ncbi:TetR/AcrR family transcriptional regulator [Actinophytocola sp.]|uniref:TetR/AcrR family transcriptional regulator n=1 Tax=Actinophytocola sp. TaxID=1872138 RepID=UPI002ED2EDB6
MAPNADRRVRRTRSLLRAALIDLILERGYDRVTVQDILDRADVGRSTFYSHFQGKDQLLLSGMDELSATLHDRMSTEPDTSSLMTPLRPLFEHAADNRRLFSALLGRRGANVALRAGRRMLTNVLATHLRTRLNVEDQQRLDLTVAFLVNGLLGLFTWWLDTQPHLTADRVYADFEHLATQGISAFLTTDS